MGPITWYSWFIVAMLLFIAEIFIPTFFAACLAIGCILAGIFSILNFGLEVQLIAFSAGTLLSIFSVRPLMIKYAHRQTGKVNTNADALAGKSGIVTVTIDNSLNKGRVLVEGDDWKASSVNDELIQEGERIEVVKVNSTILVVKRLKL
jgi:membrane protein implicated in regulation of membrane protease activity